MQKFIGKVGLEDTCLLISVFHVSVNGIRAVSEKKVTTFCCVSNHSLKSGGIAWKTMFIETDEYITNSHSPPQTSPVKQGLLTD